MLALYLVLFATLLVEGTFAQATPQRFSSKVEPRTETANTKPPDKTTSPISVRVCAITATGFPCSPASVIYEDKEMVTLKTAEEVESDGSYSFYAGSGSYLLEITGGSIPTRDVPVEIPLVQSAQDSQRAIVVVTPEPFSLRLAQNLIAKSKTAPTQDSPETVGQPSKANTDESALDNPTNPRLDSVQLFKRSKPDPLEFRLFPSQEHPVCSLQDKSSNDWLAYYCGHANDWTKQRERYQTVLVYAGEAQYKLHHRVVGASWWAANILAIGAGIADVEVTQWDIHHGPPGREGNPLMGKTRGQAYAMVGGMELLAVLTSIHRKRAMTINDELGIQHGAQWWNKMPWWSPYAGQIATHMIGIASGLARR
jgi:hypothetical protein